MENLLPYDIENPSSIEEYGKKLQGKCLRMMIDLQDSHSRHRDVSVRKGAFGDVLERAYFNICPGSSQEPDFKEAGVELKSVPLKTKGTKFVSKERLVLGMINYHHLSRERWASCHLMKKNEHLLLVLYVHEFDRNLLDYLIKLVRLWEFSPKDRLIIKHDWETIRSMVLKGKAHLLSEGDTLYLGAARKGRFGADRTSQPFSTDQAKTRAFSLKQSYVNQMIAQLLYGARPSEGQEPVISKVDDLGKGRSLKELVIARLSAYYGMNERQLYAKFKVAVNTKPKHRYNLITRKMLGVGEKSRIEEFDKANIVVRTVRLERNERLKESVSFPAFDYHDLVKEDWETSTLKNDFLARSFLFVVFKGDKGSAVFEKAFFWAFPAKNMNKAKIVWSKTVEAIRTGNESQFPRISDDLLLHVRPHGRDGSDKSMTPGGKWWIKRCFWLNSGYLRGEILHRLHLEH
jgi:DNA mismatch repair protein MutH